jgi:hypothetical protein
VHGTTPDDPLTPPLDEPTGGGERPPLLGSWPAIYTAIIVELLGIIALCGWLSRQH